MKQYKVVFKEESMATLTVTADDVNVDTTEYNIVFYNFITDHATVAAIPYGDVKYVISN